MKLYKASSTVVVYFMSDKTDLKLEFAATDFIIESVRHNGVETPTVVEVTGVERPASDWEPTDFVYGSEDATGDEPMDLKTAMERAASMSAAKKADARALPAPKGGR